MSLHPDKFKRSKGPALSLSNGFTLVEALVALTLLTVGLIPAFLQATTALTLSTTIKNSLVAANLAQEGVEVVHALRDDNWFSSQPFDTGLTVGDDELQWNSMAPLNASQDRFLQVTPDGRYEYGGGTPSIFKRKISISTVSADELKVVSTVTWQERTGSKQFVVEEHLFNWAP